MLKSNSKKKISSLLAAIAVIVIAASGVTDVSHAYSAFSTDEFNVTIDVHEDSTMSVTEEIKINAFSLMHGIYRYIPVTGNAYMEIDGSTEEINRAMKIKNIEVPLYEYDTYNDSGNKVIQIGSSNYTISGPQVYTIKYDCILYEDGLETKDFFYYNVIPQGWETSIGSATVVINMPSSFDTEKVHCYVGGYGYSDEERAEIFVEGSTITVYCEDLGVREGITVQVDLPEGYFVGALSNDWMIPVMYGLILAAVILAALLWYFFGRDPQVVPTVEFYAPEGMTPAEAGYILDGIADKEDIVSMIIYFADKGYLRIKEETQTADGLAGKLFAKDETIFYIYKLKNYHEDKPFARTIFDGLFESGDKVELSELSGEFYEHYRLAISELKSYHKDDSAKEVFTTSSSVSRKLALVLTAVPITIAMFFTERIAHANIAPFMPIVAISTITGYLIAVSGYDKRHSSSKSSQFFRYLFGAAIVGIASICALTVCVVFCEAVTAPMTAIAASIIIFIFTMLMKKRTDSSAAVLGKLLGFKEFIKLAEKDRLELLVHDDPSYFYNILPYAYVFGLSDVWAGKFESIAVEPPEWYTGYDRGIFNTYVFMNSFNRCADEINSITVPPADSDGGGGLGGGGSFGGGGGFSGGGFGGGGGGGW